MVSGFFGLLISQPVYAAKCGGVDTNIVNCDTTADAKDGGAIWDLLLQAINLLSALVGLAAVGGIIYGSILYTTAGGSADKTKKAKGMILNVVIGLVMYALLYSFLNFIIPGGVL